MSEKQQRFLKQHHKRRPGGDYKKTSITIHSTGNPSSTAANERAWLDNPSNNIDASWHYVVDEKEIIQAIPDMEEAWHCGNGKGNKYSIGIEICESGDRRKTLENAAAFTAEKLKSLDLSTANLKQHHDWTGKNCPRILIDKAYIKEGLDWNWFLQKVQQNLMKGEQNNMEKRYQTIEEMPAWAKDTVQKLISQRKFADSKKLDLSMDMLRLLVIMNR